MIPLIFDDMLTMAWSLLEFVVTYIFIICMAIFVGIMAWTIVQKAGKLIKMSAPGWNKLLGRKH